MMMMSLSAIPKGVLGRLALAHSVSRRVPAFVPRAVATRFLSSSSDATTSDVVVTQQPPTSSSSCGTPGGAASKKGEHGNQKGRCFLVDPSHV